MLNVIGKIVEGRTIATLKKPFRNPSDGIPHVHVCTMCVTKCSFSNQEVEICFRLIAFGYRMFIIM